MYTPTILKYEIIERDTGKVLGVCHTYSDQRALMSYYYYFGYRKGLYARKAEKTT